MDIDSNTEELRTRALAFRESQPAAVIFPVSPTADPVVAAVLEGTTGWEEAYGQMCEQREASADAILAKAGFTATQFDAGDADNATKIRQSIGGI